MFIKSVLSAWGLTLYWSHTLVVIKGTAVLVLQRWHVLSGRMLLEKNTYSSYCRRLLFFISLQYGN